MPLAERVALITGAGSGIGEATARRFAAEGAIVVVNDVEVEQARSVASDIQKDGGSALAIGANVTRRDEVEVMVTRIASEFGRRCMSTPDSSGVVKGQAGCHRDKSGVRHA